MSDLPAQFDPETQARAAGYSWDEIDSHIGQATAVAGQNGYSQQEIDRHLGYNDPTTFRDQARVNWATTMANPDDSTLQNLSSSDPTIDLNSPSMPDEYGQAVLNREVKTPQDFAYQYAASALDAAHTSLDLPEDNSEEKLKAAAYSADDLATTLPHPRDFTDASLSLASDFGVDPNNPDIKSNLVDHWKNTGQHPIDAAQEATTNPDLAASLTSPKQPQRNLAEEAWSGVRSSLANGFVFPVSKAGDAIFRAVGDLTGSLAIKQWAAEETANTAQAIADENKQSSPDASFLSSPVHYLARGAGELGGMAAQYAAFGVPSMVGLGALAGAETAHAANDGNPYATSLGALIGGAEAYAPIGAMHGANFLTEGKGLVSSVVATAMGMAGVGVVQTLADPLPGLVANGEYRAPSASELMEAAASNGLVGAILGPLGHYASIKSMDPENPGVEITPSDLIKLAGEQTPTHEAAAQYAMMDPANRQSTMEKEFGNYATTQALSEKAKITETLATTNREAFDEFSSPTYFQDIQKRGLTAEQGRAEVEKLIPSYEAAQGWLHAAKALGFNLMRNEEGSLTLHHGTGVVFASELGAPYGRFQLGKIGAGEGAQMFSWGLYFAQDKNIAKWYMDADLRRKGTDEGSLYTVHIDAEPHEFLDWDKRFDQQPKAIQEGVKKALGKWAEEHEDEMGLMKGEDLFKRLMREKGASAADIGAMKGPANRLSSLALAEQGIKGMRFTDAATRGLPEAERTYNHVIYDPKLIKITHRNGVPTRNTLFSTLMPIISGPVDRLGKVVETISNKLSDKTPEQIIQHHMNQAARDLIQREIIKNVGKANRSLAIAAKSLEPFRKLIAPHIDEFRQAYATKDPAQIMNTVIGNFLNYVEGRSSGAELATSNLKPLADIMRTTNIEMANKLFNYYRNGKISFNSFLIDYFRHAWKNPNGETWDAFKNYYVGKQGSSESLRQRDIPTTIDGLTRGLIPRFDNPIDMMLFDLGQKHRYLASIDIQDAAKEAGYAYYAASPRPGDIQLRGARSEVGGDGVVIHLFAPQGLATSYNNWLDNGIYGAQQDVATYERLLWAANTLTGLKLVLPTFHSVVISLASWSSTFGRAWKEFGRGQFGAATKDFMLSATFFGPIVNDLAKGREFIRRYANGSDDPIIQQMAEAGLTMGPRQTIYRTGPRSFQQSVKAGGMREIFRDIASDWKSIAGDPEIEALGRRLKLAPLRGLEAPVANLGRVMQSITDPLFDHAIPAAKAAAVFQNFESWLRENKGVSEETKYNKMREMVKDVDNRYGELNQDTLFWRRRFKQAANLSMISTGWNYGSYRGFLGAVGIDIDRLDRLGAGERLKWNPTVAMGTVGTIVGFMYANAILQTLKTKQTPFQTNTPFQDLLNYRTGGTSKYGTPERGMIPSEMKELYDLFRAITFAVGTGAPSQIGPAVGTYIHGKLNPFFQALDAFFRTGQDGQGHMIAFTKGAWENYFKEMFTPIFLEQIHDARKGSHVSLPEIAMGFREAAHDIEDYNGYMKGLQGLAKKWTAIELYRAKKEAIDRGEIPPSNPASNQRILRSYSYHPSPSFHYQSRQVPSFGPTYHYSPRKRHY